MSHASLGHPIGMGSSSEVFGLDAATVLKLYRSHVDPSLIAREALVAAHATRLGLSTAAPLGRQMADGRHGLILERVHGPVMMRAVRARPIGALLALRRLARLQAAIHAHPAPEGLRRQREGLAFDIAQADAPPAIQRRAQAALERLPDGDRLCHGDLHPSNVMLDRDGAMRVIDWSRAAAGNPHADVIRSELLIRFAAQGRGGLADRALDLVRDLLGRWYVRCYARAAGVPVKAITAWRLPIAVAWHRGARTSRAGAFTRMVARLAGETAVPRPSLGRALLQRAPILLTLACSSCV